MEKRLILRQLIDADSSTFTYILADPETGDAVLIDPVLDQIDRDLQHLEEMGLSLKYTVETHIHADHVTGSGVIRTKTGCAVVAGEGTKLECADILVSDGEELTFGSRTLKAIATPGHTRGCTSYYIKGMVFTGDCLLIRACGRTDFQGGSSSELFDSVKKKLYKLPPETEVYPGHDYLGQTVSTLEEEMKYNKRIPLNQKKKAFESQMKKLKLPYPQKMDRAIPANEQCGNIQFTEISPKELSLHTKTYTLVDVRSKAEYDEGHIEGSILAPLGHNFIKFLSKEDPTKTYVFICRIGQRSSQATDIAREQGFKKALNLKGGVVAWSKLNLPLVKGEGK